MLKFISLESDNKESMDEGTVSEPIFVLDDSTHLITQKDLNDLVRDLNLTKLHAEI